MTKTEIASNFWACPIEFFVFNVYVPSFLFNCKSEKVKKRQGHEKGQSKDKYVKCDTADEVLIGI